MAGWIKLHRDILSHWSTDEPECFAVWVRMLLEANHEDKKRMINGCLVEIKRGQLVYGREAFSARSGVSIAKLRRYVDHLETDGMISQQKTNKYSIISITNYDKYQVTDQQNASKTPTDDQQNATPKEVKNNKNNPPTPQGGQEYTDDFMEFWEAYPKKVGKGAAFKRWKKLKPSAELRAKIIWAVEAQKRSERWLKDGGQFIPDPSRWLNESRWDDEIQPKRTGGFVS